MDAVERLENSVNRLLGRHEELRRDNDRLRAQAASLTEENDKLRATLSRERAMRAEALRRVEFILDKLRDLDCAGQDL